MGSVDVVWVRWEIPMALCLGETAWAPSADEAKARLYSVRSIVINYSMLPPSKDS